MRITDIHIDGFGVWHDLSIRRLSSEITAFYGPNEAGKTTLMQFLRSVLYGMNSERRKRYLPPFAGGTPGGSLAVDCEDGPLRITRIADRGPDDVGKVTIATADGGEHGDRLLREELEHVDEVTYNNVFAVGLRDIQELGSLDGTAAAQWLYRLTSGLDRVSLYDVIHLLRGSLRRLLNNPDETSEIRTLITRREALRGEFEELVTKGRRWAQSAVKLGELADEIQRLQEESKLLTATGRRLETAINLKPLWTKRNNLDEQIASYSGLYPLPDSAIAELDDLNERIEEHERQRDIVKGQRHQLRDEAEALGINQLLEMHHCRLCGLQEQQEWLEALARQADTIDEEVEELETRLESENRRLVARWLDEADRSEHLTDDLFAQLAPQAKAISATADLVSQAQANLADRRQSELQFRTKLESATASGDKLGLPADIKQASELVAGLRERQEVEQRVEKARRQIRDLEQQNFELAESQLMSMDWLLLLLGVFVASTMALGARFLGWIDGESSFGNLVEWLAPLGIFGVGFAVFWKQVAQRVAADRLDEWFLEMEDAERVLKKALAQQKHLAGSTPGGEGSISLRLQQAERHLEELERTLPVEGRRRAAAQEIKAAQERLEQAEKKHQAARDNWRNKLRSLGLADAVTPEDLQAIAGQREQLETLRAKAQLRREEGDSRRRDFDNITRRIAHLAEETGLVVEDADPLEQLEHLLEVDREQKARIKHRDGLRERAKELKAEEARHARAAVGLSRRRDALFQNCGVESEQAFRDLADKHVQCRRLREKRKSVTREIAAAIGQKASEEDYAPLMTAEAIGRLEHEWETNSARVDEIEATLKQLLERRGRMVEKQRLLAEDRSLARKQMEIDQLDLQIQHAKQAWRERAVVYHMLERIRDEYEKNRQPETLTEASEYMRQLTSDRYKRVWTPLANDVLMVETAEGESLPVEVLSTGTREQLFVSLRMAMVAMYARRGIQLPMILDDVFVNFDVGRTRIAIEVLRQFASDGHQLLIFTCHEHVWRMFQEVKADARRLPDRFAGKTYEQPQPEEEVVEAEVVAVEPPKPRKRKREKPAPIPLPDYVYAEVAEESEVVELPEYEYEYAVEQPAEETVVERVVEITVPQEVEYSWAS